MVEILAKTNMKHGTFSFPFEVIYPIFLYSMDYVL
jgi:hypothetical protein